MQLGYCTNVHAGDTLLAIQQGLEEHAVLVRDHWGCQGPLPVGLWFPNSAARQLAAPGRAAEFRNWLEERQLQAYTLNGFPFGDFHASRVKHAVYRPAWYEPARLDYTCRLIDILADLLPTGARGSISTLPIAWGTPRPTAEALEQAARQLQHVAEYLHRLYDRRGIRVNLCLEPEPGCALQRSVDVVAYLQDYVFRSGNEARLRETIQVCHDICHAAVMFEPQAAAWENYAAAGISVGKVQLSSALRAEVGGSPIERRKTLNSLQRFVEDRYLHQTMIRSPTGEQLFCEDLVDALDDGFSRSGEWRIHFHIPIYLATIEGLATTQDAIRSFASVLDTNPPSSPPHLEVETYAWNVLPPGAACSPLASGIAAELRWAGEVLANP